MHPERVGPYLIDRKIGAGGMGNVYHGVHESTGQEVAVKVLPASMAREDGFVQRFTREIDALRQLSNRHIVQLYHDGATDDGTFYYAMEFVDGVTLTSEIIERKRLPWKDVLDLAMQIAAALKAAHDAGIIHRDLKPSNLMLTRDRVLKLTDFGVASLFASTRLTRTGGVVGTAEYMSPEQARGQRASRRSDLYSLGAVIYAMLTGRPPFTGASANDILQKHQFSQFDKPSRYVPELPRLLEELVCQLLEKDPAKRLPDALVVMKRLEQIRTRLEFAEQNLESETVERSGPESIDTGGQDAGESDEHQPGPATMVRNLIRDDVKSSLAKSTVARFFDNTFVLISMLILIIAFGYWMNVRSMVRPGDQLRMARAALQREAGPGWIRVRDEILQPLLEAGTVPEAEVEVRQMIETVNQYDFCRSLKSNPESSYDTATELQRLIRRAFEEYDQGDPVSAREQIQALLNVIGRDPSNSYLRMFLESTAKQWDEQPLTTGRTVLLQTMIRDVEALLQTNRVTSETATSLRSALQLYGDDRSVTTELDQIRKLLSRVEAEFP
jgi:serine/threonine protein kinase